MTASDDETLWTLDQHLLAGHRAVEQIRRVDPSLSAEPICHHFSELDQVEWTIGLHAAYHHLVPTFSGIGLDLILGPLEAWEIASPNLDWLRIRIPAIIDLASVSGFRYQGWSWEPSGQELISATDFPLFDNR